MGFRTPTLWCGPWSLGDEGPHRSVAMCVAIANCPSAWDDLNNTPFVLVRIVCSTVAHGDSGFLTS